jgi:hypothetical protein
MPKRALAALLSLLILVPHASAQVIGRAGAAPVTGVPAVPRVNGLPGGVTGLSSPAIGLTPSLQGLPSLAPAPTLSAGLMPAAAASSLSRSAPASVLSAAAAAPALPASALQAAAAAPAPASAHSPVLPSLDAPAGLSAPHEAPAPGAKGALNAAVSELSDARTPSLRTRVLDRLFTGARELLGLGEGPAAVAPVALTASAPAALQPAAPGLSPAAPAAPAEGRATPPSPVALVGRGLNPGEKLLASPADAPKPAAAPAAAPQPGSPDYINWKGVKWMMTQRTISTAAFILTSIAYPIVVIQAVGPLEFGALMALGPMASIALGPVNGLIASKMDNPRKGLAMLALLRAGLAVVLPVLALTGNVTFVPLLIASIANGWQFSLLMTSENAFMAKFAGRNHLGKLTTLGFTTYFMLQVTMGTLLVVGSFIDAWNPMTPFWISAAVHLALTFLILAKVPNIAPDAATLAKRAAAAAEKAAKGWAQRAREFGAKAGAFLKKFWLEEAIFAASVVLYVTGVPFALPLIGAIAAGQPLFMSAALLFWVTRSEPFKKMWATGAVRNAILLSALSAGLFYPFQNLALPLVATALGSKALFYGQLLGAFFFGQLVSNAGKASGLPVFFGKPLEFWIRHVVVAMGAAWAALRLFAGDPLVMAGAALAAAAIGYGLINITKRLTDLGWIRFLGIGLAGAGGVAAFWGVYPAIFASVMLMGLFLGPFVSAINGYITKNSTDADRAMNFGVSSSLFNAATSIGYALMTLDIKVTGGSFPLALWPVAVVFAVAGLVFFFKAPKWLPGLPETSLTPKAPKTPAAGDKK